MKKHEPAKVFLLMANNPSTPYFSRFAKVSHRNPEVALTFVALCPDKPSMLDEMEALGCACHWVRFDSKARKRGFLVSVVKLYLLFRKYRPDVVHTHLFDDALPGLLAAWLAGVRCRVISKLDAGFHHLYTPQWVFLDRLNNRLSTAIVAVSEANREFVLKTEGADPAKVTVIHQGLPASEVTTRSATIQKELRRRFQLGDEKVVLTVARFVDIKGYPDLIAAAKIAASRHADVRFICVGYGELREHFESMALSQGLAGKILFSDWISREELNNLFGLATIYLHAALVEPFGFTIAEAMFNGTPVVSTNVGAARDGLEHKVSAYLVAPGDSQGLADGITFMLSADRGPIAARAKLAATDLFSIEAMWLKHVQLYLRCVQPT